jgi:hypothetical protein
LERSWWLVIALRRLLGDARERIEHEGMGMRLSMSMR